MVGREIERSKGDGECWRDNGLERNEKGKEGGDRREGVLMPSMRHMNEYNFAEEQRGPLLSTALPFSSNWSRIYVCENIVGYRAQKFT